MINQGSCKWQLLVRGSREASLEASNSAHVTPKMSSKRCFCEHCSEFLCIHTFKAHRNEFYDAVLEKKCTEKRVNIHCQKEDLKDNSIISGELCKSS